MADRKDKDYPEVGVCSWKAWSQEAACWVIDRRRGNYPARLLGSGYHMALRLVRQRPFRANPWRQCFARYAMTPREAALTIFGSDPAADAEWLRLSNEFSNLPRRRGGGGLGVPA
jgi:hypothetical protein